jgi:hypothetical protein
MPFNRQPSFKYANNVSAWSFRILKGDYNDKNLENQFNKLIEFNRIYTSLDFDTILDIKKQPTLNLVKQYCQLIKKYGDLSLEERDIQELECLINELPVLEALKD